jgi:hypothetical protein
MWNAVVTPLCVSVVQRRSKVAHKYILAKSVAWIFLRGRWAPIWGCCRGCGAHLIWVTSIDAFCQKKSQIALSKRSYFTVLHIRESFTHRITNLGTLRSQVLKSMPQYETEEFKYLQGLKPPLFSTFYGTTEVVPCREVSCPRFSDRRPPSDRKADPSGLKPS